MYVQQESSRRLETQRTHLQHLKEEQQRTRLRLYNKVDELKVQEEHLQSEEYKLEQLIQHDKDDFDALEQYSVEREQSLRLQQKRQKDLLVQKQKQDQDMQVLEKQICDTEQIISLLECDVANKEHACHSQSARLRALTEQEKQLRTKQEHCTEQLQSLHSQLMQKQGAILTLENEVAGNEHVYHNQTAFLRELTGKEKTLQIKQAQDKERLQGLHTQLMQKQGAIFLLENHVINHEQEYNNQTAFLRELMGKEKALQIKQARDKARLQHIRTKLLRQEEVVLCLERSADEVECALRNQSKRRRTLMETEWTPQATDDNQLQLTDAHGVTMLLENAAADTESRQKQRQHAEEHPVDHRSGGIYSTEVVLNCEKNEKSAKKKHRIRSPHMPLAIPESEIDEVD